MKKSILLKYLFIVSLYQHIETVFAQTIHSDDEVTNNVVMIEEYQFNQTSVTDADKSNIKTITKSQFKDGILVNTTKENIGTIKLSSYVQNLYNNDGKTNFSYKEDKHGNWVKRLKIELNQKISDKETITYTSRKVTYKNTEVTGSDAYDYEFINQAFSEYISKNIGDKLTQCISGNCQNGYGTINYGASSHYNGYFKNGKKHGHGTYHYANGDVYMGQFIADKMSGQGTYDFKNGSQYKGQMLDNKFHGKGIYNYYTGNRFDGNWLNGKFDGIGNYYDAKLNKTYKNTYKDGAIFNKPIKLPKLPSTKPLIKPSKTKGCIKGNCTNGTGTFINEYGDKYVGGFNNSQYHGVGEMITIDGTVYHGGFKNGQFSGQGFFITPSGIHFIGRFNKNLKVGEGITFYQDGNKEACFYIDDVCQGMATFILKYGNSFQYVYDNGKIANPEQFKKDLLVAMKHGGHNPKDGCIWGNCENGLGMIMNNLIESYIGYFVNGKKSGFGHFRYVSDDIHYGFYANNKKHGIGYTYHFKTGKRQKNLYKDGLVDRKLDTTDIGKKKL